MLVLEQSDRFKEELETIVNFIALDSVNRALEFFDQYNSKTKSNTY